MFSLHSRRWLAVLTLVAIAGLGLTAFGRVSGARAQRSRTVQVTVPGEDRFTPFSITIRAGDVVRWVNQDTDNHTVVSDDVFNSAGHNGTNHLLVGTDANGGQPGVFSLRFNHPGTFVYYCRFHSHLDADNQPVAPGPLGGIQDTNGNFGTPMMGVITVLPGNDDNSQN